MLHQISADNEVHRLPLEPEPIVESQVEVQTALHCLAFVAVRHGVDLSVEQLRHAHAIDGSALAVPAILRIAKQAGLRAKTTKVDWQTLVNLREACPAMVQLANGNWVVVAGI